jgi:hypothetical protein
MSVGGISSEGLKEGERERERGGDKAVWENINDPCTVAGGRVFFRKGRKHLPHNGGGNL